MTQEPENKYLIDPKHAQEMIRLIEQNNIFTTAMQGSFDAIDLETVQSVLDIGCGPGGWILQAAYEHPTIEFYGVDISKEMIEYAQAQAEALALKNATFEQRTALVEQSDFPSIYTLPQEQYDFINTRLCAGFMKNEQWSPLFQQCWKLLKPRGVLRSTEIDHLSIIGAPTLYRWMVTLSDTMRREGRTFFTEEGQQGAVTPMMRKLLEDVGFLTQKKSYVIDYSAGQPTHEVMVADSLRGFDLLFPYLLKAKTEEELNEWRKQLIRELDSPDFYVDMYLLSVIAKKI